MNGFFSRVSKSNSDCHRDPSRSLDFEKLEHRHLLAADLVSFDGVWQSMEFEDVMQIQGTNYVQANSFSLYDLVDDELSQQLAGAPMEFTPGYEEAAVVITVARPDNSFETFAVVEAPIMEADLAEQFPEIKTYRGIGLEDSTARIRLDTTPQGFHAQVLSYNGAYYVDPYYHLDDSVYMSYFTTDALRNSSEFIEESLFSATGELLYSLTESEHEHNHEHDHEHNHEHDPDHEHEHEHQENTVSSSAGNLNTGEPGGPIVGEAVSFGDQLRTYRTAVAATGEYTQFHGGSVAAGQAAIVTAMNRVTGLYENDLAVRMVLIGNNSNIVYTNSATDPYTNNNGVLMLSQNQANIDAVIGSGNYDIGHVFSTGGGGVASLGVVGVNGLKARGVTGLPSPVGDPFYVDFVAHEMGHQYAATHTFNGDSGNCSGGNRTASTAYEPGSGSTIMAYAGICGNDNLQNNSDAMFHSASIDQIRNYVTTGAGNAAAVITATGNSIPTVSAGPDFVIPVETPFELTAVGSDPDPGDVLTYSWEQRNLGPQNDVNAPDNGNSPIIRTFLPTTGPTRVIPGLSDLLNNTTTLGERLPTTNWNTMDFRVVVRDNAAGGGGVADDDMSIQVVDTPGSGGFAITSQNSATTWGPGSQQTVTWNVAGTTGNGINTANVDLFLSTDGGLNFDTVLASGVANNGSATITVPNLPTSNARIKVKGSGNIFFDVNDVNFTIGVTTVEIIDNGDPGFTLATSGGVWNNFTSGGYLNDINWTDPGQGDTATWTFSVTPGSTQRVSATWFNHPTLATDSPFEIFDGATSLGVFNVNQQVAPSGFPDAGATWDDLTSGVTISSGTLTVELSDIANGRVAADAIRIEEVDPSIQIIDNGDPGYTTATAGGVWNTFGAGFQGDINWTEPGQGDTATWTFTVTPGDYQVSATWFNHPTLATDSPFEIFDGATSEGVFNVNQQVAPSGFPAAGATWDDLTSSVNISSGTLVVQLSDLANGRVAADAIRIASASPDLDGGFVQVEDPSPEGIVDSAFALFENRFSFNASNPEPNSGVVIPVDHNNSIGEQAADPANHVTSSNLRSRLTFVREHVRSEMQTEPESIRTGLNVPTTVEYES